MDLINAAKMNDLKRVRLLVEQGADKDEGDYIGHTPLWWASAFRFLEATQYLVEQGATLDKADKYGKTPLITASFEGNLDIVRYLLEQGADRDKADNDGNTSLHYAVRYGQLELAMLLMSYGADLNARDNNGQLPIDLAHIEKIRQAISNEPRRRMDEAPGKRATEQDRHPNAAEQQEAVEEEQSNKLSGNVTKVETKVAEEDEDSEPSDGEDDSYGMKTRS